MVMVMVIVRSLSEMSLMSSAFLLYVYGALVVTSGCMSSSSCMALRLQK